MFRTTLASVLIAGFAAQGVLAADPTLGSMLGTSLAEISEALAAERFEITRFEVRPDTIAVTALRDDLRLDLSIDSATGAVTALSSSGRGNAPAQGGVDDDAVRAMLAAEGYTVTKYKRERREIEVYATRDGATWEIKVDPLNGQIRKIEREG